MGGLDGKISRRKLLTGAGAAAAAHILGADADAQTFPPLGHRLERTPGFSVSVDGLYYEGPLATPADLDAHLARMKELAETVIAKVMERGDTEARKFASMPTVTDKDKNDRSIAAHVIEGQLEKNTYQVDFAFAEPLESPREAQLVIGRDYYAKIGLNDALYARVDIVERWDAQTPEKKDILRFTVRVYPHTGVRVRGDGLALTNSFFPNDPSLNRPRGELTSAAGIVRLPDGSEEALDLTQGERWPEKKHEHVRRIYRSVLEILERKLAGQR